MSISPLSLAFMINSMASYMRSYAVNPIALFMASSRFFIVR